MTTALSTRSAGSTGATCRSPRPARRLGAFAERNGIPRPSYVHLRRLIVERRLFADERRELVRDALGLVYRPVPSDVDSVLERVPHPFRD